MARQTPQQKRANTAHARSIEKNMGRPEPLYKKKDVQKSPISTPMLSKPVPILSPLPPLAAPAPDIYHASITY